MLVLLLLFICQIEFSYTVSFFRSLEESQDIFCEGGTAANFPYATPMPINIIYNASISLPVKPPK